MSYFMMECFEPFDWEDSALIQAAPQVLPDGFSWTMGKRFPEPLPEPLEFTMLDTHSDQLVEFYSEDAILMTKRLLKALQEGGIDNLDVYRAVIRHPLTDFVTEDYVAANLIGLVSAADLTKSKVVGGSSDGLLDVDFDSVVIDENRTVGLLMFRLAESTNAIMVHDRVKTHILSRGIDTLSFIPPEKWIG